LNKKIEHFYSSKISSDNFLLLEEKVIWNWQNNLSMTLQVSPMPDASLTR
jgi:hypothetical protein